MMIGRCPVCHAHIGLETIVQDDAARELLGVLSALDATLGRALVAYLGLWRPAKHDLRWDRALRLAREVLALEPDAARLAWALGETVEGIRAKGGSTPIKSHNYLKRVLEGMPAAMPVLADVLPADASAARAQEDPARRPASNIRRRITAAELAAMNIRNVSFGEDDA